MDRIYVCQKGIYLASPTKTGFQRMVQEPGVVPSMRLDVLARLCSVLEAQRSRF